MPKIGGSKAFRVSWIQVANITDRKPGSDNFVDEQSLMLGH